MIINDLYENDLGYMIGTFYSNILGYEIEVMYNKNISQNYVEKNIEYFNNLDPVFLEKICIALKRYFDAYYEMNPDLSKDFADELIDEYEANPTSILKYIDIGVYAFDNYDVKNENVPVLNLTGDCAWNGDEQITILAKDNQLVYVGSFFYISIWYDKIIKKNNYNYAIPEKND